MPHIHTDPGQHDLTTSAYIIRTDLPEPAIVMHRHRILNKWLQFGGHVELHEDPWQAIKHEIQEESGYSMSQLKLLQPPNLKPFTLQGAKTHPWPAAIATYQFGDLEHHHTDMVYAFTTTEEPRDKVGDGESQDFKVFTRSELVALKEGEIPENAREMALIIFDDYLHNWQKVSAV